MGVHQNLTGAQRAARYRAAKRAQGLRLKQIWVPDLRDPKVREKFRSEGAEINRRDDAEDVMAFMSYGGVTVTVYITPKHSAPCLHPQNPL